MEMQNNLRGMMPMTAEALSAEDTFSMCKRAIQWRLNGSERIDIFEADDLAQEATIRLWQRYGSGDQINCARQAIDRAARDVLHEHFEKNERRKHLAASSPLEFEPVDQVEPMDELVERISNLPKAWNDVVLGARRRMTAEMQGFFDFRRTHPTYTNEVAAERFGISVDAAKQRSKRIRDLLLDEHADRTTYLKRELDYVRDFSERLLLHDELLSLACGKCEETDFRLLITNRLHSFADRIPREDHDRYVQPYAEAGRQLHIIATSKYTKDPLQEAIFHHNMGFRIILHPITPGMECQDLVYSHMTQTVKYLFLAGHENAFPALDGVVAIAEEFGSGFLREMLHGLGEQLPNGDLKKGFLHRLMRSRL